MGSPTATPQLLYRSTRLLRTAFQRLYQQQQRADVFCDVVLRAEGEAVVAHCSVLSVCSPFFMEQLGPELPPQGRRVVLELEGLKIGVLRKLVRFFYTAELEVTQEEVHEVLATARRLRITELESLQLWGGRLVRLGPQRQLDRSCLHSTQEVSAMLAPDTAQPNSVPVAGVSPPGAATLSGAHTPQPHQADEAAEGGEPGVLGGGAGGATPPVPPAVPASNGEVTKAQPPPVWMYGSKPVSVPRPQQPPNADKMQQDGDSLVCQQGCGQAVPPDAPGTDTEEEEIDVGTGELFLPLNTVCLWPCPSSESEEEVDVLT